MRLRAHVLLAASTGAIVGALEGGVLAAPRGALTVLAGLALGLVGGAMWGVVQWALDRASRPLLRWLAALFPGDAQDRGPIVRLHALIVAGLLLAPGYVGALVLLFRRLEAVQDPLLAAGLVAGVGAGGLLALVLAVLVLAALLLRPIAALDRKLGLPRPRALPLRLFVYLVLPPALVAAVGLVALGNRLGTLATAVWCVIYLSLEAGLALALWAAQRRRPLRVPAALRRFGPAAALGLALVVLALAEAQPRVHEGLGRTRAPALARNVLRKLADFDRDGSASILGDRDCAPLDAAIHPLAVDAPANGVDENCDGEDAAARVQASGERFSGMLAAAEVRKYNVVLIIVDALRADHTTIHGYKKKTTPYLERFAEDAQVFERALSQSSATMLSIPSMLTGRDVGAIDWDRAKDRLVSSPSIPTLAQRLKAQGYRTGLIVTDYIPIRLPGIVRGYDVMRDVVKTLKDKPANRRTESITTAYALEFLAPALAGDNKPFFLTVYYEDPHAPYVEHEGNHTKFGGGDIGRYDQEIAAVDRYAGILLETLKWSKLWDDTIVVIVADHGEEFGEHGERQHSNNCHIESLHVPLIVRVPGMETGRSDARVGLVDVTPTLLELLGLQTDEPLDGQSLFIPLRKPELVDPQRPFFCSVISQASHQPKFLRHAVRRGDDLLTHEALENTFALYDRAADPGEKRPLDPAAPAVAAKSAELEALLRGYLTGDLATHRLNH